MRYKQSVSIDSDKAEQLKALSERTRIPVAELIREGIDRVLDLAEAQHRTLELSIKNLTMRQ